MKIHAIGIDFGTTNSVVSLCENLENVSVLPIYDKTIVPTVINYKNRTEFGTFHSEGDILSIKRKIVSEDDSLQNLPKSVDEICIDIFSAINTEINKILNNEKFQAVITVPAYFNNIERSRIKYAAHKAGIHVLTLFNEPTATILAYKKIKKGTYLVYDFGGGTFDVSIISYNEGLFNVLGTSGDTQLGGDDIDKAIAKELDISIQDAKNLKESGHTNKNISKIYNHFATRTLDICADLLKSIKLSKDDIDEILMVGGSSKICYIETKLHDFFNRKPSLYEPDYSVSKGAAIKAFQIINRTNHVLIDVTPLTLGIEIYGGGMDPIIKRNSKIPCSRTEIYTIAKENQKYLKINVLQGEDIFAKNCHKIGEIRLETTTPYREFIPRFKINFTINKEGILQVTAQQFHEKENIGEPQTIIINPDYELTPKGIATLETPIPDSNESVETLLQKELKIKAQDLFKLVEEALNADRDLLTADELEQITQKLNNLHTAINGTTPLQQACQELEKYTEHFAQLRIKKLLNLH